MSCLFHRGGISPSPKWAGMEEPGHKPKLSNCFPANVTTVHEGPLLGENQPGGPECGLGLSQKRLAWLDTHAFSLLAGHLLGARKGEPRGKPADASK